MPVTEVFLPPSPGQLRLIRWFPRFFGGELSALPPALRMARAYTVAPQAQLTSLSTFEYQVYLNHVLHTRALAWWGHALLMPLVVLGILWSCALVPLGSDPWSNGSLVAAAVLGAWWTTWASARRDPVWGMASLVLLVTLWVLANLVAVRLAGTALDHPILLTWLACSGVAWSHLGEPRMPPRATFTDRWMTIPEFFWGPGGPGLRPREQLPRLAFMLVYTFLFAPINELVASPRLVILYVKELLWLLGHRRGEREALKALVDRALASGDPALDFVGVGGGVPIPSDQGLGSE